TAAKKGGTRKSASRKSASKKSASKKSSSKKSSPSRKRKVTTVTRVKRVARGVVKQAGSAIGSASDFVKDTYDNIT
ncbi:MAG: hypothetical protein M3466_16560, partial [Gemmatimonadota bacterium]|nr:hypothetical protein [Gemmatimonadota bacterium]